MPLQPNADRPDTERRRQPRPIDDSEPTLRDIDNIQDAPAEIGDPRLHPDAGEEEDEFLAPEQFGDERYTDNAPRRTLNGGRTNDPDGN